MATLKNIRISDQGYIQIASGNTAQRPASPQVGMIRFNTDFGVMEVYGSSGWQSDYGKTVQSPANSATEIRENFPGNKSGFYYIKGVDDVPFLEFCDMTV